MRILRLSPRVNRIAAVELARERSEFLLRRLELPLRDGEETVGVHRDTFVECELPLEEIAPEAERGARFGRRVFLEKLDVARNRVCRFGGRIGQIAEQVHVVERRKCAR